jgi:hypothetical protein
MRLPPDRLAGFNCPKGKGKEETKQEPPAAQCPGRINSTHKRQPCSGKNKKKAAAAAAPPVVLFVPKGQRVSVFVCTRSL